MAQPPSPPGEEGEEADDFFFDPDIFIIRDYKTVTYSFDSLEVSLLCSTAASTDHDLTGQIVWPVAELLAWFVVRREDLFRGKKVVELGAGCGITGLVAARVGAERVALTDGNEIVLELLQQNAEKESERGEARVECLELSWGEDESHAAFRDTFGAPDVVIGADVVYWPSSVEPLVDTVKRLLGEAVAAGAEAPAFYCGYVCRALQTQRALEEGAASGGLVIEREDIGSFLPEGRHRISERDLSTMTLYRFSLP